MILYIQPMSDGMGRELAYLSSHATNRYFIPNWGKVLENAPTKLKVTVNVNDADWQKIQELFAKERQWMNSEMQMHIREVNSMFADERKKVRERYKEYDGCYLGYYAQWFFWFFFVLGFFVFTSAIVMMVGRWCHWF